MQDSTVRFSDPFRERFTFGHRKPGVGRHLLGKDGDIQAAGNGCGTGQQAVAAGFCHGATQGLAEAFSMGVQQFAPVFGGQFLRRPESVTNEADAATETEPNNGWAERRRWCTGRGSNPEFQFL